VLLLKPVEAAFGQTILGTSIRGPKSLRRRSIHLLRTRWNRLPLLHILAKSVHQNGLARTLNPSDHGHRRRNCHSMFWIGSRVQEANQRNPKPGQSNSWHNVDSVSKFGFHFDIREHQDGHTYLIDFGLVHWTVQRIQLAVVWEVWGNYRADDDYISCCSAFVRAHIARIFWCVEVLWQRMLSRC